MYEKPFIGILAVGSAIVVHEYAHGWMANRLGDPTAKEQGRLTLNPLKHIDPWGTIILPVLLLFFHLPPIGWAKPVPVNFAKLHNPKRDIMLVGIAGPLINVIIAFLLVLIVKQYGLNYFLGYCIFINFALAVFNMIPIPPLDGSRFVVGILPKKWVVPYLRLERFGIPIVFVLFYLGLPDFYIWPVLEFIQNTLKINFLQVITQ